MSKAAGWLVGLGCLTGGVACCFTGVGTVVGLPMIAAGASIIGSTLYAEHALRNSQRFQRHALESGLYDLRLQNEDSRRIGDEQFEQVNQQLEELRTHLRRSERIRKRHESS